MDKILPYLRPALFFVFGTIIWVKQINAFMPAWSIAILCYVYGGVRGYFVWKDASKKD